MKKLPLYNLPAQAAVEKVDALPIDQECNRCSLACSNGPLGPSGIDSAKPGPTLLVVGDGPGLQETATRQFLSGKTGNFTRQLLMKYWPTGRIVFDGAFRCQAGRDTKDSAVDEAIDQCRGYLRKTIEEVQPDRIVVFGSQASSAVLGRSIPTLSVRGGYGWLWGKGSPIPVYMLSPPGLAVRNRIYARWLEEDIERALTTTSTQLPPWREETHIVETVEDAKEAARELTSGRWVALDCETFGRFYDKDFRMLCIALCGNDSDTPWVWSYEALQDAKCLAVLQSILDSIDVVGQNYKYDAQALRAIGLSTPTEYIDTRLVRRIVDPDAAADLATQAELVGLGGHKEENQALLKDAKAALLAWARNPIQEESAASVDSIMADIWVRREKAKETQERSVLRDAGFPVPRLRKNHVAPKHIYLAQPEWWTDSVRWIVSELRPDIYAYALIKTDVLYRYNALDALATAKLALKDEAILRDNERVSLVWNRALRPASKAITQVEVNGIKINEEAVRSFGSFLSLQLVEVRAALAQYGPVEPRCWADSPKQVAKLLFEDLKLPVVSTTDSGAESTDKATLESLRKKHGVIETLLEWRRLNKLKSTYADGLLPYIQNDRRVHSSFDVTGARSGRVASSGPNCQNAPRAGTTEGKIFRDCFIAETNCLLVEGDFSQVELRVAAMLSGDEEMKKIFLSGQDFHMQTAKLIAPVVWKIKPEEITKEHRSLAKQFVFGPLYGQGANGMSMRTGISKQEAQDILDAILGRFKQLSAWIRTQVREAHRVGGSYTWWDGIEKFRWRALPGLADPDDGKRSHAENGSFNGRIQGSANEFCLSSLVAIDSWLEQSGFPAKIVLTVHDSILCEVKKGKEVELIDKMRTIMTGWESLGVPMEVDFKVGGSWGSMEDYKIPESKNVVNG